LVGHTDQQSQTNETSMGALEESVLVLRIYFEKVGSGDLAKEDNIPSHIHTELALQALQSAIAGIRFIEQNDFSGSEFRGRLPAVLDELNKATYFLNRLKALSTRTPIFLNN
jgi:hypothetical protein